MTHQATDRFMATQLLANDGLLADFISVSQRFALKDLLGSEEGDYFATTVLALAKRIRDMPKTYETDDQGLAARVYLHYFLGGVDAWITEKDKGTGDPEDTTQRQAFGKCRIQPHDGELGYISIAELIDNGVELDLHWDCHNTLQDLTD